MRPKGEKGASEAMLFKANGLSGRSVKTQAQDLRLDDPRQSAGSRNLGTYRLVQPGTTPGKRPENQIRSQRAFSHCACRTEAISTIPSSRFPLPRQGANRKNWGEVACPLSPSQGQSALDPTEIGPKRLLAQPGGLGQL